MSRHIQMYEDLCEMLNSELSTLVKQGEITQENLDWIDKLTHAIKSVKTTIAMIEAEESGDYGYSRNSYGMSRGDSYNRGGNSYEYSRDGSYDGMSNDYSRDDSYDGSYAHRGRDGDGDGRYSERRDMRGRYSRDASKDQLIQKLEHLANDTMNTQDKQAIQNLIQQMRQ